jgi:two-component system sensor histidine kinase KdpD
VRRRWQGLAAAIVLLPLVTLLLANTRDDLNITSDLLVYLVAVVAVSLIGGAYPGLAAAVAASLFLNYYFVPPFYRLTIYQHDNVIALIAFVLVAATISVIVDAASRRSVQAARANAESQLLATAAGSVLRGEAALPALLERLREALSLSSVGLLERDEQNPEKWSCVATVGDPACERLDDADAAATAGERLVLVARGHPLRADDQRLMTVFAAQAASALEQRRLTEAADAAKPLAEADRMRTALLAAVSHDLRSPLASVTASVDSLSNHNIEWTEEQRDQLLQTAQESLQQLTRLVDNLLEMSRLQAGALSVFLEPVGLDDVIPVALDTLTGSARQVQIDVPPSLPEVRADPALLERVIANVVANAVRFAPPDVPPRLAASTYADRVELRVIDHGPGVPRHDHDKIFTPFQRLGDTDNTTGVGLGLALSRGLTEAMGGHLTPEETPGGGLTLVIDLPAASGSDASGSDFAADVNADVNYESTP